MMKHRHAVLLSCCASLLAACAHVAPPLPAPVPAPALIPAPVPLVEAPSPPPPVAVPPLTPAQAQKAIANAVSLLQGGHEDAARAELQRVLAADPSNTRAQHLMRQVTGDPVALLGRESFAYTVRPNDSLSTLAARFLGDGRSFYLLARYNNIAVPNRLAEGQVLRIPGKAPPPAAPRETIVKADGSAAGMTAPTPVPMSAVAAPVPAPAAATVAVPSPPVSQAPAPLPAPASVRATPPPVLPAPVAPSVGAAPPASARPVAPGAETVAPAAVPAVPSALAVAPAAVSGSSGAPSAPEAGERAMQAGVAAEGANDADRALAAYREAAALDQPGAAAKVELLRKRLIQRYGANARTAFARQDLAGAVREWDRVLAVDPGNETALLERQRALALKAKVDGLGK